MCKESNRFVSLLTPLCLYFHIVFFPRLCLSTGTPNSTSINLVSYIKSLKYLMFVLISAAPSFHVPFATVVILLMFAETLL